MVNSLVKGSQAEKAIQLESKCRKIKIKFEITFSEEGGGTQLNFNFVRITGERERGMFSRAVILPVPLCKRPSFKSQLEGETEHFAKQFGENIRDSRKNL